MTAAVTGAGSEALNSIQYRCGYRYQLASDFTIEIPILPPVDISTRFIRLSRLGVLTIRQDYSWDGPSGPTADTPSTMRAALIHDALYQLIRDGHLGAESRGVADLIFKSVLIEDGVFPPRAEAFYRGVAQFGEPYVDPASEKAVMRAPATKP